MYTLHLPNTKQMCLLTPLPEAPLNGDVDQTLRLTQWNLSNAHPSIYRQDPNPRVDAAWDKLERCKLTHFVFHSTISLPFHISATVFSTISLLRSLCTEMILTTPSQHHPGQRLRSLSCRFQFPRNSTTRP